MIAEQKWQEIKEGKSKKIYIDEDNVYLFFKGDVRCSTQKDQEDARIAELRVKTTYQLYHYLNNKIPGVLAPEMVNSMTLKMKKVEPYPLEWIPRFVAAGSVVKRFGFQYGHVFKEPVLKIDYKTEVEDYLITDMLIIEKGIMSQKELENAKNFCINIALILREMFRQKGLSLWDLKLELGKTKDNSIVLIDEISFDNMRLKDMATGESYDKDVFRQTGNIGFTLKAYEKAYSMIFK